MPISPPLVLHQSNNPSSPHKLRLEHLRNMEEWVINIGKSFSSAVGICLTDEQMKELVNYINSELD